MNSLQTPCLHEHLYFCIDCLQPLCEICILNKHYQHTIQHNHRNLQLINLNNKHIKWLQHKEQQVDILNKIIQFQIQEKIKLNHTIINQHNIHDFQQISDQIINTDHQKIIYNQVESIFINQQSNNNTHFYLINQVLTQNSWIQLFQQLDILIEPYQLYFIFKDSSINLLFLKNLIDWLQIQTSLQYLEIDLKNTNLDDSFTLLLKQFLNIPNLKYLEIQVTNSCITIDSLVEFWFQNQNQVKQKFDYFYVFHHFYSFGHDNNFGQEIMMSKASIFLNQNEINQ